MREKIGARTVAQIVCRLSVRSNIRSTIASECLAECARYKINPRGGTAMLWCPSPVFSHNAHRVRVINHYECVVLVRQITDFFQGCDVAVHTENTVCVDDAQTLALRRFQFLLERRNVHMFVNMSLGF